MFAVFCPYQEARFVIAPGDIIETRRRADGVAVRYRCWCGHVGVHVVPAETWPTPLRVIPAA